MSILDLSNQYISQSYSTLVQISSSTQLFNGNGQYIPSINVTAGAASRITITTNNSGGTGYSPVFVSGSLSGNLLPMIDPAGLFFYPTNNRSEEHTSEL